MATKPAKRTTKGARPKRSTTVRGRAVPRRGAPKRARPKGASQRPSAKRGAAKATRTVARAKPAKHGGQAPPPARPGFIAHTELVSTDPAATKQWAATALGWDFHFTMPTPGGDYHMWRSIDRTGGGIRKPGPGEPLGTVPYVEVKSVKAGYQASLAAGAQEAMPPMEIQGGYGWMAIVRAPGGPMVGLWSNKA